MNLHDKVILTDADGVLFSWASAFDEWAYQKGYKKQKEGVYDVADSYGLSKNESYTLIEQFNQSSWTGYLAPHLDAVKYVQQLHNNFGYIFRVITSFVQDVFSMQLRRMNLYNVFGQDVFESIHCIGDEDKADYLEPYRDTGCFFLEDKITNVTKATCRGMQGVLFEHPYNKEFCDPDVIKVKNWKEFYEYILNQRCLNY